MSDDARTIRQCLAGDEQAYRELVGQYQRRVYALALRMVRQAEDAEDITQETFVRMFRALDRYDLERPFSTWLFTIASRLCIDHIRRRRTAPVALYYRDSESGEEREIEVQDAGVRPDEAAQREQEERKVQGLIDALPPHYRVVVVLRHQQELSYEEIAEVLGMPLGTVKARIHRARALLARRLGGDTP